jgi:hypothetical protein
VQPKGGLPLHLEQHHAKLSGSCGELCQALRPGLLAICIVSAGVAGTNSLISYPVLRVPNRSKPSLMFPGPSAYLICIGCYSKEDLCVFEYNSVRFRRGR